MTRRARAALAAALFALALGAGLAGWSSGYVTGWTLLAVALALTALNVAAPLCDEGDALDVERVTLDEACARLDEVRR